jgi:hypothetical protein
MNEHERETAFLRRCIGYDNTDESRSLEQKIAQAQNNERCVRRAVWLIILLTAIAIAGLCYAVFLADLRENRSELLVKVFGALGLASLLCLPGFLGYWGIHRKELDRQREECRGLAAQLLESRVGKPLVASLVLDERAKPAEGRG